MKPVFSNNANLGPNIKLVEKNELLQNDQEIADELNTLFKNTASNLEINENPYIINHVSVDILDPTEKYINKYEINPNLSVLSAISNIFEKLMQKQILGHIEIFLFPYLCGYRKIFNTQQTLLALIENWKKVLEKKGFGEAVLMDLSKAFDTKI